MTDRGRGLGELCWLVLKHLAADDADSADVHLADLYRRGGKSALYGACAAWAELIGEHMIGPRHDGAYVAFQVGYADTMETCEPETLPAEMAPALWAGRFVTAIANADAETAIALFNAELAAGNADGIPALAELAATVVTELTR